MIWETTDTGYTLIHAETGAVATLTKIEWDSKCYLCEVEAVAYNYHFKQIMNDREEAANKAETIIKELEYGSESYFESDQS